MIGIIILIIVILIVLAAAERSPEETAKIKRNQQLTNYCLRYKKEYGIFPMSYKEYEEKTKAPLD